MFTERFNNAELTDIEKVNLIKEYKNHAGFMWMLQMAFSPFKVFAQSPKLLLENEIIQDKHYQLQNLKEAVEFMLEARNSNFSEEKINNVVSRFLLQCPEQITLFTGIINKNLYGLNRNLINEAIGWELIPQIQIPNFTNFRPDFYNKHSEWYSFPKRAGAVVQILKYGKLIEVYAKSGNPFRIFDDIRNKFAKIPIDGFFNAQLFYLDESDTSNQKLFFSETSKKSQSTNYRLEVFDYALPSTTIASFRTTETYQDRLTVLDFIFNKNNVGDNISMANVKKVVELPGISNLLIASEVPYNRLKPKDFLLIN